ncbi:MAG: hypothetical protein LBB23_01575 [Rickettsiales bacterium]|jgi:hypothetical protein|nr:hypothetical protein [Rickettsiales bacterium]
MALPAVGILIRLALPYIVQGVAWIFATSAVLYYYGKTLTGQDLGTITLADIFGQSQTACIFCPHIRQLVGAMDNAALSVYEVFVNHIWVMMLLGFGVFATITAFQLLKKSADQTAQIEDLGERTFDFTKWIDTLWRQGVRIVIVGVILGAIGSLGSTMPRIATEITLKPILSMGTYISLGIAGLPDSLCPNSLSLSENSKVPFAGEGVPRSGGVVVNNSPASAGQGGGITESATEPLLCFSNIITTITLAGAAKGFDTMNNAGINKPILWFFGLALAVFFALYGVKLFFELMNILFTILFFIMFLPVIIAGYAFDNVWPVAKNITSNALSQTLGLAVAMVSLALKLSVFYYMIMFAVNNHPSSPFAALLTLTFVFLFYYNVVEAKLMGRFSKPDAFINFGTNAEGALRRGITYAGKYTLGIGKTIAGWFK